MTDSILKLQSVRRNLDAIDSSRIPNADEIEDCLETADSSLKEVLGYGGAMQKPARKGGEKPKDSK